MAIAILRPGAIGTYDAMLLSAGASKVAAIDSLDPVSHDDDTTYLSQSAGGGAQTFTVSSGSIPPVISTVISLTGHIRNRAEVDTEDAYYAFRMRLSGTDSDSSAQTNSTTSYVNLNYATLARPGGGSWGAGDITTALEFGSKHTANNLASRHTSYWVDLSYTISKGDQVILIIGLLGAFVNVGLHEMPRFAQHLARVTRGWLIYQSNELRGLCEDMRSFRHPSRFFYKGAMLCA